jgi:hypothetical protein
MPDAGGRDKGKRGLLVVSCDASRCPCPPLSRGQAFVVRQLKWIPDQVGNDIRREAWIPAPDQSWPST